MTGHDRIKRGWGGLAGALCMSGQIMLAQPAAGQTTSMHDVAEMVVQCRGLMDSVPQKTGKPEVDAKFASAHDFFVLLSDKFNADKVLTADENAANLKAGRDIYLTRDANQISTGLVTCLNLADQAGNKVSKR